MILGRPALAFGAALLVAHPLALFLEAAIGSTGTLLAATAVGAGVYAGVLVAIDTGLLAELRAIRASLRTTR